MEMNELRRKMNDILTKSHYDSKLDYCLCCGKKVSSFCNSHSLPKFILKNISKDGYVLTSNNYFKMPLYDNKKGLNNSGIFKRICNECDNKLFKDYESLDKIVLPPRKKLMTQIDLKNSLRMCDKRLNEVAMYSNMSHMTKDYIFLYDIQETMKVRWLDLNEIEKEINRDLNILSKSSSSSFELIFWDKLDYVSSMAFQGHVALIGDLDGKTINDVYNKSKDYVIENLNICVFPLANETIVMMFVNKDNKKYRNFIKQFKKLKKDDKLKLISYIIFNYSEDFFVSKEAKDELINNRQLDIIVQSTSDIYALSEEMADNLKNQKKLELTEYNKFPNILGKDYSLSKNI